MSKFLGSRQEESELWNRKRYFNGTLYLGILDQLVCRNCGINLTYGFLCKYNRRTWNWYVMCDPCRDLHLKYEQSFIRFKQP